MFNTQIEMNINKDELYIELTKLGKAIIKEEKDLIANLSNLSALFNQYITDNNWIGFYLLKNNELVLGPFQGKVACIRIPLGKGVCGNAALRNETIVVKNVHEFEGHIACDSETNSEIVIPINIKGKLFGVLDIDSKTIGRFTVEESKYMEKMIAEIFNQEEFSNVFEL